MYAGYEEHRSKFEEALEEQNIGAMVQVLKELGVGASETDYYQNASTVSYLLMSTGVPIDDILLALPELANYKVSSERGGIKPIGTFIENGRMDLVSSLLKAGADPNVYDKRQLLLKTAIDCGQAPMVLLLINYNADLSKPPSIPGGMRKRNPSPEEMELLEVLRKGTISSYVSYELHKHEALEKPIINLLKLHAGERVEFTQDDARRIESFMYKMTHDLSRQAKFRQIVSCFKLMKMHDGEEVEFTSDDEKQVTLVMHKTMPYLPKQEECSPVLAPFLKFHEAHLCKVVTKVPAADNPALAKILSYLPIEDLKNIMLSGVGIQMGKQGFGARLLGINEGKELEADTR